MNVNLYVKTLAGHDPLRDLLDARDFDKLRCVCKAFGQLQLNLRQETKNGITVERRFKSFKGHIEKMGFYTASPWVMTIEGGMKRLYLRQRNGNQWEWSGTKELPLAFVPRDGGGFDTDPLSTWVIEIGDSLFTLVPKPQDDGKNIGAIGKGKILGVSRYAWTSFRAITGPNEKQSSCDQKCMNLVMAAMAASSNPSAHEKFIKAGWNCPGINILDRPDKVQYYVSGMKEGRPRLITFDKHHRLMVHDLNGSKLSYKLLGEGLIHPPTQAQYKLKTLWQQPWLVGHTTQELKWGDRDFQHYALFYNLVEDANGTVGIDSIPPPTGTTTAIRLQKSKVSQLPIRNDLFMPELVTGWRNVTHIERRHLTWQIHNWIAPMFKLTTWTIGKKKGEPRWVKLDPRFSEATLETKRAEPMTFGAKAFVQIPLRSGNKVEIARINMVEPRPPQYFKVYEDYKLFAGVKGRLTWNGAQYTLRPAANGNFALRRCTEKGIELMRFFGPFDRAAKMKTYQEDGNVRVLSWHGSKLALFDITLGES